MHFFKGYLKRRYHFIAGILALFIFLYPMEPAYAATFSHTHTSSCYKGVDVWCGNHSIRTTYDKKTQHCPRCGYQTQHTVESNWDVCNRGMVPDRYDDDSLICDNCGNVTKSATNPTCSDHSWVEYRLSCPYGSAPAATLTLDAASSSWTNGSVTLNANVSISQSGFSLAADPFDFGAGRTSDPSFTVDSNGTYSVSVTAANGQTVTETVTVSCIDKTSPSLSLSKDTDAWTEAGVTVSVDASDDESGLAAAPFSYNGGAFTSDNSYHMSSNGDLTVTVMDAAGNTSSQTITIANIGRDPAIIEAERRAAEEAARLEAEREAAEQARIEAERQAAENARLEAERKAQEAEKAAAAAKKKAEEEKNKKKDDKTGTEAAGSVNGKNGDSAAGKEKTAGAAAYIETYVIDRSGLHGKNPFSYDVTSGVYGAAAGGIRVYDRTSQSSNGNVSSGSEGSGNSGAVPGEGDLAGLEYIGDPEGSDTSGDGTLTPGGPTGFILASVGGLPVYVGLIVMLIGMLTASCFNYVYESENGKVKLRALVKVKADENKVEVFIKNSEVLEKGRYMIYLSPWIRIRYKDVPVFVSFADGTGNPIRVDSGKAFAL